MSAGSVSLLNKPTSSSATAVAVPAGLPNQTAARSTDRLALLDGVRMIAAIGIVWVHAATSPAAAALWPIGTFGVPFYTFAAVLFMTRSLTKPGGKTLGQYAASRFTRIYLPFLFWSAIYVLLGEFKTILETHRFHMPSPVVLYAGGHAHLWFLPFLMAVTILGAVMVKAIQAAPAVRRPLIGLLMVLGVVAAIVPEPAWVAQRPWDYDFWRYMLRALPTVCWALALALATAMNGKLPRTNKSLAFGGLILVIASLCVEAVFPLKVLRATAGLGCILIALMPLNSPGIAKFGSIGKYSYGIYLSHVAFLRLMAIGYERYGVPSSLASDAAAFAVAFVGAATLSVVFSKSKWTRWMLGE